MLYKIECNLIEYLGILFDSTAKLPPLLMRILNTLLYKMPLTKRSKFNETRRMLHHTSNLHP
jgi:hypothetical protein